jgi:hypothetical protein
MLKMMIMTIMMIMTNGLISASLANNYECDEDDSGVGDYDYDDNDDKRQWRRQCNWRLSAKRYCQAAVNFNDL